MPIVHQNQQLPNLAANVAPLPPLQTSWHSSRTCQPREVFLLQRKLEALLAAVGPDLAALETQLSDTLASPGSTFHEHHLLVLLLPSPPPCRQAGTAAGPIVP